VKLTSSRFAAAIGLNPYCSRQALFRQLTGQETVPFVAAMQWGIDHEMDAVGGAEAFLGMMFNYTGQDQRHFVKKLCGYEFGTTPDGIRERIEVGRLAPKRVGLEVKCPQKMWDEVPPHYVPQLIGQAKLADLQEIFFSVWTPDEQKVWLYSYDPAHWDWMEPLLEQFMENWEAGTEPKRQKKPALPELSIEMLTDSN
jgi:hypothetical protein